VNVHTLRHSAASAMLTGGVPLLTVSRMLGHSSVSITGDIYGRITDDGGREAAAALAKALERTERGDGRTATGTATGPKRRLYEGSTEVDVHGRQVRRDKGRRQERVDFSRPARTPCARLGVKGSQVQILSARPLFGLVRGTLVTK